MPKPLSALAPGRKGSHQPPPQPQQVTPLSSSQQMLSPITPMVPFTPISPSVESFGSQLSRTVASGTLNSGETLPGPGAVSQMWYGTSMLANRPLIVIDAHPQQRKWADEIRRSLELDEFQVWCSCDWQADSGIEIDSVDSGDSDANLSTIVECNEHVQNNSGRSTIDSLHSPDRSATLDKVSSTGNAKQFSSTLDIPNACRRPTSLTSSPTRSRHTTPNRSPQASNENLHDSSTTCLNHLNQIESKTNRSEQLNGCASSTASSSSGTSSLSVSSCNMSAPAVPNNTRRALLPNRRPTSLPVGSADPPTLGERKRISRLISQSSDISQLNTLTPEKMERLKRFQDKVTSAEVVIVLVSSAYFTSRTSQKHAYYCEHRKKMILVRVDESKVSPWFANLMGEDIGLSVNNPRYLQMLRNRVRQKKEGGLMASSSRDIAESKLQYLVSYMKKNLPVLDTCVYVIGSSKLQCERSIQICKAIGQELAKLRNVTVVTSGFYGAGDLIARSFYESRRQKLLSESQQLGSAAGNMMAAQSPSTPLLHVSSETSTPCGRLADRWAASFRSQVVHILPLKEQQDFSDRCPQNPDGTFDARDYGETLFLGECMKERESVVARLLNTCIVVEGGTGTAKEAEEFIWNDSYVVPVMSTGGAASGQFGVPMKIFECPPGVNEQDWQMLSDSHATPEEVARSVVRILVHLKQSIAACAKFHQQEQINGSVLGALGSLGLGAGVKVKKSLRKKRLSEKLEQMSRTPSIASVHLEGMSVTGNYTPSSVAGIGNELLPMMPVDRVKTSKWWRVQKIIPFASKKM